MNFRESAAVNIYNTFLRLPDAPRLVKVTWQSVSGVKEGLKSSDPHLFDRVRY